MPPSATVSRRILLVDDDPLVRDSIRRVLQFEGHSVEVAPDGHEALVMFQKSSFDLVVTDFDMPGITGGQLATAIKTILPLQPILMISAHGEQLRSQGNPVAAVDAFMSKPFRIEELRQAIFNLLVECNGFVIPPSGPDAAQTRLRP